METATKHIPHLNHSNVKEIRMNTPRIGKTLVALAVLASGSVLAQSNSATDTFIDRNINQQQRIEQGLQSGQLSTREAARLEKQEGKVESMEARALRDGNVSQKEANRIDHAQDQLSRNIYREKHDAQRGNPNSASSQRMQQDVQRNINQQQRIEQGLNSGQLTQREAGRLERHESQINRMQGRAGADGHVGRFEQQRIQTAQNGQSNAIWRQKHDGQQRGAQGYGGNHFGQQSHHGNGSGAHANQRQGMGRPSIARR